MERVPVHRRLLAGWMAITARFGFVQTLVILAIFYVTLIGPIGLGAGLLRRDLLGKGHLREEGSAWQKADSAEPSLERAKEMS